METIKIYFSGNLEFPMQIKKSSLCNNNAASVVLVVNLPKHKTQTRLTHKRPTDILT